MPGGPGLKHLCPSVILRSCPYAEASGHGEGWGRFITHSLDVPDCPLPSIRVQMATEANLSTGTGDKEVNKPGELGNEMRSERKRKM